MKIRTLIVDDEPLARRRVESLLQDDDEFEVVGTCASGVDIAVIPNAANAATVVPHRLRDCGGLS